MPANVEQMFSVREMPWHGEGYVPDRYPQDWDEARKWAGLEWEPVAEPVYQLSGMDELGRPVYTEIPDFQRVSRSDTGATLTVAPESYTIIDHKDFGNIFEAVLQQSGNLKAETGGVLEGGRKVWMLLKLDEPIVLPGDASETMPYLGITSRHDRLGSAILRTTAVRIVCANTFGMSEAEGERTGATFSFRHTKNWRDHVDDAREAVTAARKELREYEELAAGLLGIKVTPAQRKLFVAQFVPEPPKGLISPRVEANVARARGDLTRIIESETIKGAKVEDSAYGLVMAATEYLDHVRKSRSWETKLNRTLLRNEPLKARAVKLAREVATA